MKRQRVDEQLDATLIGVPWSRLQRRFVGELMRGGPVRSPLFHRHGLPYSPRVNERDNLQHLLERLCAAGYAVRTFRTDPTKERTTHYQLYRGWRP